jgi:hypothetical protein
MDCSTSVQIYKNYKCQQVFVSKVQKELIDHNFSRLLEFPYLLQYWDMVCACQPDHSAKFIDRHGSLLVKIGAMVDLQ